MEQLLATQPWPFAQAMISAAAEELKQLVAMGVFTFNGTTVRDAWAMGTSPLQVSEVATLKVSPDGVFEKCKWRVTINGSGEKAGVHYQGSSHHPAPSTSTTRYFMAGEANMPKGERCCQVDVSSAYNVTRGLAKPPNGTPIRKTPRNGPLAPSVGHLLAMCGRRRRCQCAFSVVAPGSSAVFRPCWRLMGHQLGRSGIDEGKSRRSPKTERI